ncbi:excinuclease ABC subunit UvrB [Candidatus Woesearchaeota archaeon]|nr:excinuclease ABC subunit UvrB [Candidatus Woesearchaeota archaeon]
MTDLFPKTEKNFVLKTSMTPKGSQPVAIKKIVEGFAKKGFDKQVLLGITGSGKTFTMANVISQIQKSTLVLAHNKTLAWQLYQELKLLFPGNAVEYFVSYYDYYQPESYLPSTDTYIEKDAKSNEKIEEMRLKATTSLVSRTDTIIVCSVSCIYGLGSPENFEKLSFELKKKQVINRQEIIRALVDIQYERNDADLSPGKYRVRGDTIEIRQGYGEELIRIEMFGDEVEKISLLHPTSNKTLKEISGVMVMPARHYVVTEEQINNAISSIRDELEEVIPSMEQLEAHRLKTRTNHDLEMIEELGFCSGIENYSRHFEGRSAGEPPFTLIDFFPKDFLFIIDESHQTIPQLHGMYKGDYSRKKNLIDFGFRLPSAFDNRPLKFEEVVPYMNKTIYVSATPAEWEVRVSGQVVEQIIRPTGLLDPIVEVRPTRNQIDDVIHEIKENTKKGFRTLVTTLTKRMAEELSEYLARADVKTRYLHSEVDTIERTEIIRQLRLKEFDCLVGINLLREGLDIPEVSLVIILDADKEGFLRNERSLIQTIGRAARNTEGRVILYADKKTDSMNKAIKITKDRRRKQEEHNTKNKIIPKTIIKPIQVEAHTKIKDTKHIPKKNIPSLIVSLEAEMNEAAEKLEFELAIEIRDRIETYKKRLEE